MARPFRLALSVLAATAGVASAHDFWLQPRDFSVAPGAPVPTTILVGHGSFRQRWSGDPKRVVQFRDVGPGGASVDLRSTLRQVSTEDAEPRFATPGTHILVFESTSAESNLPAIRYNDYAKVEGLTPALQLRQQTRQTEAPGREIYSRRCKALVQVGQPGAAPQPQVTRPLGLTLEIVPERSPYALGPKDRFPVRILYEGRPLAGALVKLTSLEFDARPLETHLSDAAGRASFDVPRTGTWLVNVIWTKPIKDPRADFDTTFSSLTFAYPAARR